MRYLTLSEVLYLHDRVLEVSGGLVGVRDLARVESAIAQPKATFDGTELHPTVVAKAAALCFSQATVWRQASSSTQLSTSPIRPASSAAGRKWSGVTTPSVGWFQRTSASKPAIRLVPSAMMG